MPVRYLSDAELAIAEHDAVTFFTLTDDDRAWLAGFHRADNRLGVAVQLCTMPWLGWIPQQLTGCPAVALGRLASRLGIDPDEAAALLAGYGGWHGRTRRDHRAQVLTRLGWRWCAAGERKQLDDCWTRRWPVPTPAPAANCPNACAPRGTPSPTKLPRT